MLSDDEQRRMSRPHDLVYREVGECLHAWTCVENELSALFVALNGVSMNEPSHPLRQIFEVVQSFEVRLAMVSKAVDCFAEQLEDFPSAWVTLKNKISRSARQRHEVAHFLGVGRRTDNNDFSGIKPFFTRHNFMNNEGRGELSARQIADRARGFFDLSSRVRRHAGYVSRVRGLPLESDLAAYARADLLAG